MVCIASVAALSSSTLSYMTTLMTMPAFTRSHSGSVRVVHRVRLDKQSQLALLAWPHCRAGRPGFGLLKRILLRCLFGSQRGARWPSIHVRHANLKTSPVLALRRLIRSFGGMGLEPGVDGAEPGIMETAQPMWELDAVGTW